MPGFELAAIMARPDPLLAFKWMCPDSTLPFGHPTIYLESVDLPFNNIDVGEQMAFQGGKISYPGPHATGAISMSFYEDENALTTKWLLRWKSALKDFATGGYGLPKDYKRDMRVVMLNNQHKAVLTAQLIGIWPTDTTALQLSYGHTERVVITQAFAIDFVHTT